MEPRAAVLRGSGNRQFRLGPATREPGDPVLIEIDLHQSIDNFGRPYTNWFTRYRWRCCERTGGWTSRVHVAKSAGRRHARAHRDEGAPAVEEHW